MVVFSHNDLAKQTLKESIRLKKLGHLNEALDKVKAVLESFPACSQCWIELGRLHRLKSDHLQALRAFQSAASLNSKDIISRLDIITTQLYFGEAEKAQRTIDEVFAINSRHPLAFVKHGEIYQHLEDYENAEQCFRNAIDIDPHSLPAYIALANTLWCSGSREEAVTFLRNSPVTVAMTARVQRRLGEFYRQLSNFSKSIECFSNVLRLHPSDRAAYIGLALAHKDGGDFDTAKSHLLHVLNLHPQNFRALLELGDIEKQKNQVELALNYYEQAKKYCGDSLYSELKIAQLYIFSNQFAQAEVTLDTLLKKYPEDSRVLMQYGYLERQRENRSLSLDWFHRARKSTTDFSKIKRAQLEEIEDLREIGELDAALQLVNNLLEHDSSDIAIQMRLGRILQQRLDLISAALIYSDILEQDPYHLQSRIELARTWSQSGQINWAIELLTNTYQDLGPQLPVLMQLGQLFTALDKWDSARQWYEEAYEKYPFMPQTAIALANHLVKDGEKEAGYAILEKSAARLPHVVDIPLKVAQLDGQAGNLEQAIDRLEQLQAQFPHHVPICISLTRLHMQAGDFEVAETVVEAIRTDRTQWKKQIHHIRGELATQQYAYDKAEKFYQQALTFRPTLHDRNRLATVLTALGRLDDASTQLKLATEELGLKSPPGLVVVPLISHPAQIIEAFKINPLLLIQLNKSQTETCEERLSALAQIITQDPMYLGSNLTLAKELRHQGIFAQLQNALPGRLSNLQPIPKRIIQYWDDPEPPREIQELSQTWKILNPDYEYQRYSYQDALDFLNEHYGNDDRVLTAFKQCDQPATQADFFRLAYLNKMGGFYADADDRCRNSLDNIIERNPELVLLQEEFGTIGNNFIGCIPSQTTIRVAFYRAITNLLNYSTENPWFQTGPVLITCSFCNTLLPYLTDTDYRLWPRLWVLSQKELRSFVTQHIPLPYKRTEKSWSYSAYRQRLSTTANNLKRLPVKITGA